MEKNQITFKLSPSIRDKATKMKKLYKYKTYDLLFTDVLDFFLDHQISPSEAKKPIHKLISEVRDTLVSFHKTFESKKLMPLLFELKKQYLSTNLTIQNFVNYSTEYNNYLLNILENVPQKRTGNEGITQAKIVNFKSEDQEEESQEKKRQNSTNYDELKILLSEFEKNKIAKFNDGQNVFQYEVITYNRYIDKMKLILNRK